MTAHAFTRGARPLAAESPARNRANAAWWRERVATYAAALKRREVYEDTSVVPIADVVRELLAMLDGQEPTR